MTSRPHISLKPALLLIASLLFSLPAFAAESFTFADDFFHGGAMRYLSNNIPAALDIVTNGLQKFPNDEKLKKLEELLNQKQKQQDQQQDQQKSDDQKPQDQKKDQSKQSKPDDKQKEQEKKDQQKSDEQKEKEKQDQQKKSQQPKPDDQKNPEEQPQPAAPQKGEPMTPEQAMRVLDTTKGDENVLPLQMEKPPQSSDKKLKDW